MLLSETARHSSLCGRGHCQQSHDPSLSGLGQSCHGGPGILTTDTHTHTHTHTHKVAGFRVWCFKADRNRR